MNKIILHISRYIIAALFIFSGFVKCVDPTGTAIKLEEYFTAFGIEFLNPLAMTFSILMCGIELLVGIMILFNLFMKPAIWGAAALMIFYTPLTLWLAISNKVTDCGCFGDAITLTNWETFIKNLVLDVFIVILVVGRNGFVKPSNKGSQIVLTAAFLVLVFGFEFYNLLRLPVIDFMPYKKGTNIPTAMAIPENAPQEIRDYVFIYEKDGQKKNFSMNDLPDSTWTFVDRKEGKLIQKGYVPEIHDFMITTPDNMDITDAVLSNPVNTYLLVISSLNKTHMASYSHINRIAQEAITKGYGFIAVTSSLPEEYELFRQQTQASYPIYMMDGTTLKTMIRSNPGLMLIQNGTILGKWHHTAFKNFKVD